MGRALLRVVGFGKLPRQVRAALPRMLPSWLRRSSTAPVRARAFCAQGRLAWMWTRRRARPLAELPVSGWVLTAYTFTTCKKGGAVESLEQAKAAVVCEDVFYDSAWQGRRIHAQVWLPAPGLAPCGIVQLVHGMEEYIGRYDDFARFLCAQGFVVCGSDHIGHGQSVGSTDELSLLPVDGARMMIADVRSLQVRMQERFGAQLPYILFGHSMGSFVARAFLARFGSSLDGAIICGTGEVPVAASRAGGWLARRMAASEGPDAKSAFINSLADGAYGKKIKDARTSLDWLNTDPAQVDAYIAERGYSGFDGEGFCAFYASKGWKVGNQPMRDWRRACVTWQKRREAERPTTREKEADGFDDFKI